jgi:hypothetical protein
MDGNPQNGFEEWNFLTAIKLDFGKRMDITCTEIPGKEQRFSDG